MCTQRAGGRWKDSPPPHPPWEAAQIPRLSPGKLLVTCPATLTLNLTSSLHTHPRGTSRNTGGFQALLVFGRA